jgi:hypothetical protein
MAKRVVERNQALTGIEILAGAAPPVHLDLNVQFTAQHQPDMHHSLPAALSEGLMGQEEKLLRWLTASSSHQMSFLTDPVGSLAKAGIKLPPGATETLLGLHRLKEPVNVLPAGVKLSSLVVGVTKKQTSEKTPADASHPKARRPRSKR